MGDFKLLHSMMGVLFGLLETGCSAILSHAISTKFVTACSYTLITTLLLALMGCAVKPTGTTQFASGGTRISSAQMYSNYQKIATADNYADVVDNLGQMTLADEYTQNLATTTNAPLQIDNYVFEGVYDQLMARQQALAALANIFPSQADYWEELGIDPHQPIDQATFEEGLAAMDRSFRINATGTAGLGMLSLEDTIAIEQARLVFANSGQSSAGLALAGQSGGGAGSGAGQAAGAFSGAVTGRTSMNPMDATQCFGTPANGSEKINGKWIAGVDGATLGTQYDASGAAGAGSRCGQTFTITNTATGASQDFIIADRIWQNDGSSGGTYNQKSNADAKSSSQGGGYSQVDIAVGAYNSLFGGNNPAAGSYTISQPQ